LHWTSFSEFSSAEKTCASDTYFQGAHRCIYCANFLTAEKTFFVFSTKQWGIDFLSKQAQQVIISRIMSERPESTHVDGARTLLEMLIPEDKISKL
jgi:hypothetical protein